MITIKTPAEIAVMRHASQIVAEILEALAAAVRPGITTEELDKLAEDLTYKKGAKPAFKGYKPGDVVYPKSLCVSINNEIVHGIPSSRKLKAGDIVGLDFGVVYEGFYGDSARTVAVGPIPERVTKLLQVTRDSLYAGIAQARAGNRISDIARAVQDTVERAGFSVVTDFAGHGIGRRLHEDPQVPNFVSAQLKRHDFRLEPGLVVAIEPMVNAGTKNVRVLKDHWTVETKDRKPSVHFEHTVAITADGPDILTLQEK